MELLKKNKASKRRGLSFFINLFNLLPSSIQHFLHLSSTSILTQIARLFSGIVNANLLTPILYSTNSMVNTIVRYTSFGHFGVQNGINRDIPISFGRNEMAKINITLMTGFWTLVLLSLIYVAFFFVLFFFKISLFDSIPIIYYIDLLILSILNLFVSYFNSFLVTTKRYVLLSKIRLICDVGGSVLTIILVYFFRLHGLFAAIAVLHIIRIYLCIYKSNFKISFIFSFGVWRQLVKTGFPILLSTVIYTLLITADILFVAKYFSKTDVGLYGFALTLTGFLRMYIISLSDIIGPKMGNYFGVNNEKASSLTEYLNLFGCKMIVFLGLLTSFFFFGVPILITHFLPDYKCSIDIFRFLILSAFTFAIYIPFGHCLTLLKKQIFIIVLFAIGYVSIRIVLFVFDSLQTDLISVSKVVFLNSIILSFSIMIISRKIVSNKYINKYQIKQFFYYLVIIFLFLFSSKVNFTSNVFLGLIQELFKLIIINVVILSLFMKVSYNSNLLEFSKKYLLRICKR